MDYIGHNSYDNGLCGIQKNISLIICMYMVMEKKDGGRGHI